MNRRGFLQLLGIGVAVAAVPDALRSYFFAPNGGWVRTTTDERPQNYRQQLLLIYPDSSALAAMLAKMRALESHAMNVEYKLFLRHVGAVAFLS